MHTNAQQASPMGTAGLTLDEEIQDEPRLLEQVEAFFDRASLKSGIPVDYLSYIKACDNIIRFTIPLKRDNGTLELVTCYRA